MNNFCQQIFSLSFVSGVIFMPPLAYAETDVLSVTIPDWSQLRPNRNGPVEETNFVSLNGTISGGWRGYLGKFTLTCGINTKDEPNALFSAIHIETPKTAGSFQIIDDYQISIARSLSGEGRGKPLSVSFSKKGGQTRGKLCAYDAKFTFKDCEPTTAHVNADEVWLQAAKLDNLCRLLMRPSAYQAIQNEETPQRTADRQLFKGTLHDMVNRLGD